MLMVADELLNRTILLMILCLCVVANLECGQAQVWKNPRTEVRTDGWVKDGGHFYGMGASWAGYEESCGEDDFNLTFKLKRLSDELRVNININGPDRYAICFDNVSSLGSGYLLSCYILKYVGEGGHVAKFIGNKTYVDPTKEYQVSIISRDGQIQVYIERIEPASLFSAAAVIKQFAIESPLVIDYLDPDPLPPGEIDFETLEGGYAELYDVVLTCLSTAKNQPPTVASLIPDPDTPAVNQPVRWRASAYDPEKDPIYYSFWLTGPSTGGLWELQQNWSKSDWWDWYPSQEGIYWIGAYATDGRHTAAEILYGEVSWINEVVYAEERPDLGNVTFIRADPARLVSGTHLGSYWGSVPANQTLVVVNDTLTIGEARLIADMLADDLNGTVVGWFDFMKMYQIETDSKNFTDLEKDIVYARDYPFIDLAFPNQQMYRESPDSPSDDPLNDVVYEGKKCDGYKIVGVREAWEIIADYHHPLHQVCVGVTDDGLYRWEKSNEFDNISINTSLSTYPFDPVELSCPLNKFQIAGSHGTGVMNILSADPYNGGLVGIASKPLGDKLDIILINIFWTVNGTIPEELDFTTESLKALVYEINNGATIISCSWGTGQPDTHMTKMYNQLLKKIRYQTNCSRILFVCSAGNNGTDYLNKEITHIPGGMALDNMITVGNIDNDGSKALDSNYDGDEFEVTLFAPGEQAVWGRDDNNNITNIRGGTSMATPHVTAASAIIRSIDPTLTAKDIKNKLKETADVVVSDRKSLYVLRIDSAVESVIENPSEELSKWQYPPTPSVSTEDLDVPIVNGGRSQMNLDTETTSEVDFWYLNLNLLDDASSKNRSADLDLTRIGKVVFGQGRIAADYQNVPTSPSSLPRPTHDEGIDSMKWWLDQDVSQPVSQTRYLVGASGSVAGRGLNLNLVSPDQNLLYKLNIRFDGYGSISGSYESYNAIEKIGSGSCTGSYTSNRGQTTTASKSEDGITTIGSMESKYSIDF
jgi:hypothetical protein